MSPPKKPLSFFLIKGFGRDFFSWIVCEYWWSVGLTKEITICCGLMILIYLNITQVWDLFHQFSCKLAKKKKRGEWAFPSTPADPGTPTRRCFAAEPSARPCSLADEGLASSAYCGRAHPAKPTHSFSHAPPSSHNFPPMSSAPA